MTDFKNYLRLSLLRMKSLLWVLLILTSLEAFSQKDSSGIIIGSVLDEKSKALEGATIQLISFKDTLHRRSILSTSTGIFEITHIPFGYYKLRISYVGLQPISFDSIHFRAERFDFNFNDIVLKQTTSNLEEIIIYAEKPLIQSKDGNITFNAGESALSAGSNASDLLTNVPLVSKDPSGKLTVRGKEPKILIDDKPVELNLQQLQDLLESMSGSSIEKIEVMTNPPPQYASEQGGVINIVTRKGTVGMNGRLTVYGGTRGETGVNAGFNYRKQGFTLNINAGAGYNDFDGNGYSKRKIDIGDSSQNNTSNYTNKSLRPNFRANVNYDLNKYHTINLVLQYNQNDFDNQNRIEYENFNRYNEISRFFDRTIISSGESYNPNITLSYTAKTKRVGETLKLISSLNYSDYETRRNFFEQYYNPDHTVNGKDSTQQQTTNNLTNGYNVRLDYNRPLQNRKTFLSLGGFYNLSRSDIDARAFYLEKTSGGWNDLDALTNHFLFYQYINNFRTSVKQILGENFSVTAGLSAEQTKVKFDLFKTTSTEKNSYWNYLPFANLNKNWRDVLNLTFSYRRTIRRPGVIELNPTKDSSDQFNIRFGNPELKPSLANNFDLVLGKSKNGFYANLGLGYNSVEDVFSQLRTTPSEITWQNIRGRKEYEISTWSGFTMNKRTKVNLSASYTYNAYSAFDKEKRKFRNGGSFTSNLNTNYTLKEIYNATGSFTFNRFANPQGTVKSSLSMNLGLQARWLQRKLVVTLNVIDPFVQQQNRTFTYGSNFSQENYSITQTRNLRLSLGYVFSRQQKRKGAASAKNILKALPKS